MKPELFGRGSWYFIFKFFFLYNKKLIDQYELFDMIREKKEFDKKLDEMRSIYFKNNILFSYNFIKNASAEEIRNNADHYITEELKKKINYIINGLPCEECKTHAKEHISKNNIYESDSFLYIFHFFIELRNRFYPNEIDRSLFETKDDLIKNEDYFFYRIINTSIV